MNNTGLILEPIKDFIFLGSNSKIDNQIILEDGNWTKYKTKNEGQKKDFDTWNCVAFSACNAIEIFFKYLLIGKKISTKNLTWLIEKGYLVDGEINFSDRFVGTKAGTKVGVGNTGSRVANAIHTFGLVPESYHPFEYGMKEKEYYKATPRVLDELGKEFLERFKINFESFFIKDVKEALKYAPVQVYVNAWHKKDGLYYNPTEKINHAVARIRTATKQIFDHYEPFIKSLTTTYYYYPSGYKYTVDEIINHMNVDEFLIENDLLFVRNIKTGQFGRVMQKKLMIVETNDRGSLMLLDEAVRKNGRGLTEEEWLILPKEQF